jgi:uncharacterized Zn finger protein
MSQFSRTWWGQKFIEAMEQFSDAGRLSRGRSYASGGKVKSFEIDQGMVIAEVRGSKNPYFGVYHEPLYDTVIKFQPISAAKWTAAITYIATKAGLVSRLMLKEIPDSIDDAFATVGVHLLPHSHNDFDTHCSCPDWSNPCKHIAGVYYLLAQRLDQDPFLLFELRGLSREKLSEELAKTPLGQALSTELQAEQKPIRAARSFYPRPKTIELDADTDLRTFWHGEKRLPQTIEPATPPLVGGIAVKKQGDFPPFWEPDNSFLEAMETLYEQVRVKNQKLL